MAMVCATCGAPLEDNERFCTVCGTPVEKKKIESHIYCRQCGNLLSPDAVFCDVCGKEVERPKHKEEKPVAEEPAEMEGLVSPTITEDTFASAKELRNVKFDGFESAEDHAVKKLEDIEKEMRPKADPSFDMDAAALPERKKREFKPQEPPKPEKKEVTADTIRSSNPYGQYGAQSGGKPLMTAKPQTTPPPPPKPRTEEPKREAPRAAAPQPRQAALQSGDRQPRWACSYSRIKCRFCTPM